MRETEASFTFSLEQRLPDRSLFPRLRAHPAAIQHFVRCDWCRSVDTTMGPGWCRTCLVSSARSPAPCPTRKARSTVGRSERSASSAARVVLYGSVSDRAERVRQLGQLALGRLHQHGRDHSPYYMLSPRMFISALVQYNSSIRTLSTNARFRWEYQPGSDLSWSIATAGTRCEGVSRAGEPGVRRQDQPAVPILGSKD